MVRGRYAEAALSAADGKPGCCFPSAASSCGCGTEVPDACGDRGFGPGLYAPEDQGALPERAKLASLGCGDPGAVAERLRDRRHAPCLPALDIGIDDGFAARFPGRALLLRGELQIDAHLFEHIN